MCEGAVFIAGKAIGFAVGALPVSGVFGIADFVIGVIDKAIPAKRGAPQPKSAMGQADFAIGLAVEAI